MGESCNEETCSGNHRSVDAGDDCGLCHPAATGGDEGVMATAGEMEEGPAFTPASFSFGAAFLDAL
jgi:hypothetical protein